MRPRSVDIGQSMLTVDRRSCTQQKITSGISPVYIIAIILFV